jgi:hypothetical protein
MTPTAAPRFYGKYRGKVLNNVDPLLLGRIVAEVPAVTGSNLNWAMPCSPYAGPGVGFYAIPPIGANVWIEFEGGDSNYPIWAGCFWGEGEMSMLQPEIKMFQTEFCSIVLNDTPEAGGVSIQCKPPSVATPLTFLFNSEGITLTCPDSTIKITPVGITLNVQQSAIAAEQTIVTLSAPDPLIEIVGGQVFIPHLKTAGALE